MATSASEDLPSADGAGESVSRAAVHLDVAKPQGPLPSSSGETDMLRRRRLLAAAVFLAVVNGLVMVCLFASDNPGTFTAEGSRFSLRVGLSGLRSLLAAAVAGLLASTVPLKRKPLRAVEYGLFLGLTLLYMASAFFVGLDLIRRGPEYLPSFLTFEKNAVIQLLVLMAIYGTLIPNPASVAARTLVVMFIGPVAVRSLLLLHTDVAPIVGQLGGAEDIGTNTMFLAIGMALAIYGSFLTNGLRTELQQARKLGQYRLVRKLGEGTMGEVYLAEHPFLKRPCAVKLIKPGAGPDQIALARFEREVQSAARLAHPNTIEIYDYGRTEDGTFYYVMEYLQGLSLFELVRRAGPLPPGRVIYVFRQICAGLAEAHALGLVHRDMKPANVLVTVRGGKSDIAKILDFGIVKLTRDPDAPALTVDRSIHGTPMFMAPEQAMADSSLDDRADIYALGGMMYFALTGRPPFAGASPIAVMMAHVRDPIVPPSRHRPDLPEDLERVVLRCLEKQPGSRFPTVEVLGEALAACHSAPDWGPCRADAWWAVEMPTIHLDAPPQATAAKPAGCVRSLAGESPHPAGAHDRPETRRKMGPAFHRTSSHHEVLPER
jgi:serine/threonine-protein kinase